MSQFHVFISVQTSTKVPATIYSAIDIDLCCVVLQTWLYLPAERFISYLVKYQLESSHPTSHNSPFFHQCFQESYQKFNYLGFKKSSC